MSGRSLLDVLSGGDRRSVGNSAAVVRRVLDSPELFPQLIDGMTTGDEIIRMRTADAIEKITRTHPEFLTPYKSLILNRLPDIHQQEVRWHLAQLIPRLSLNAKERRTVVDIMQRFLQDNSSIVRTFAMQALADIASQDETLLPSILRLLKDLTATGTPAMRSRGRKLILKLEGKDPAQKNPRKRPAVRIGRR
jgi:HEAT repeat protein